MNIKSIFLKFLIIKVFDMIIRSSAYSCIRSGFISVVLFNNIQYTPSEIYVVRFYLVHVFLDLFLSFKLEHILKKSTHIVIFLYITLLINHTCVWESEKTSKQCHCAYQQKLQQSKSPYPCMLRITTPQLKKFFCLYVCRSRLTLTVQQVFSKTDDESRTWTFIR